MGSPKRIFDLLKKSVCDNLWFVWSRAGDFDVKREYLTDGNPLRDLPALTTYQRRGSLQLWQFLIALLENPANTSFIAWTGRGLEFKLVEPEEVSSRVIIVSSSFHSFIVNRVHSVYLTLN